jgi:hypothetical protein
MRLSTCFLPDAGGGGFETAQTIGEEQWLWSISPVIYSDIGISRQLDKSDNRQGFSAPPVVILGHSFSLKSVIFYDKIAK